MNILSLFQGNRKQVIVTIEQIGESQWQYRTSNGHTGYDIYATAVDAADGAARLALNDKRMVVQLADDVRDALLARWQMEGIAAHRAGKPALCWTKWHKEAYQAAQAEAKRVTVFGWPLVETRFWGGSPAEVAA